MKRTNYIPVEEVTNFFRSQNKQVVTFIGYSGAGYQDQISLKQLIIGILVKHDPDQTIINVGATPEGIGKVYEFAKNRGFITTGIVSIQANINKVPISSFVDYVFFIADAIWGGNVPGTDQLSPTSQAMVDASDIIYGIGGGEIAKDELVAAQRIGKSVKFFPADMNHEIAIEKARSKGLTEPTSFRGSAAEIFSQDNFLT